MICDCEGCRELREVRQAFALMLELLDVLPPARHLKVERVHATLTWTEGNEPVTSRDPMQLQIALVGRPRAHDGHVDGEAVVVS